MNKYLKWGLVIAIVAGVSVFGYYKLIPRENEELAAAAHVKLCQWKTAVEKYPQAYASLYTRVSCDNLCDYSLSWVLNRDL